MWQEFFPGLDPATVAAVDKRLNGGQSTYEGVVIPEGDAGKTVVEQYFRSLGEVHAARLAEAASTTLGYVHFMAVAGQGAILYCEKR